MRVRSVIADVQLTSGSVKSMQGTPPVGGAVVETGEVVGKTIEVGVAVVVGDAVVVGAAVVVGDAVVVGAAVIVGDAVVVGA